jgi:hypothetical protein
MDAKVLVEDYSRREQEMRVRDQKAKASKILIFPMY